MTAQVLNGNGKTQSKTPPVVEQLVPYNIEAEEAVLGSLILDGGSLVRIISFLKAEDFYRDTHRWVYEAAVALYERRDPVDYLTIRTELERHGRMNHVAPTFLTDLINPMEMSSVHIETYAHLVKADSIRRSIIHASGAIATLGYNRTGDIDETLAAAQQVLLDVSRGVTPGLAHIGGAVSRVMSRLETGTPPGISSGFYDLDRLTGGLQPGKLYIVGGRPGMGKSALLLNIVGNIAEAGGHVAVFSLEMSDEEMVDRMASTLARLDLARLTRNELKDEELPAAYRAMAEIDRWQLVTRYGGSINMTEIRASCMQAHVMRPLSLIVVDYVQLLSKSAQNQTAEIGMVSRGLKALAMDLGVPIIAASSLNRGVESREDKRPMMSDLRMSGDLESDADLVWLLYRDEYYFKEQSKRPKIVEIDIAKHRNGPTGVVELYYEKTEVRFGNLTQGY